MSAPREDWARFAVKAIAMGVVVLAAAFVGTSLANARDGVAGGAARSFLTVSGTLTGVSGTTMAVFHFVRAEGDGGMREMCAPTVPITPDATTHTFSAEVPIDACGAGFDGSDVTVTVDVGGTAGVVSGARVNPVPYANYASQYGTPDCPVGYELMSSVDYPLGGTRRLCVRRSTAGIAYDEIVRVGAGSSAFWIDRYEASVWTYSNGTGMQYGRSADDYPRLTFPKTGSWSTSPLYALSMAGVRPSASLTWFQANEACRATGKRLPTGDEWLTAVRRTPDPEDYVSGTDGSCRTGTGPLGNASRLTGLGAACRSDAGAEDMIGNVWEWTAEWYAGLGDAGASTTEAAPWPTSLSFPTDGTLNIANRVASVGDTTVVGLPAAAQRGGAWNTGPRAGVFALNLHDAPSYSSADVGFRCVIPR